MMMSVVRYFLETVLHILSHQQRSVAYRKQSLERIFILRFHAIFTALSTGTCVRTQRTVCQNVKREASSIPEILKGAKILKTVT